MTIASAEKQRGTKVDSWEDTTSSDDDNDSSHLADDGTTLQSRFINRSMDRYRYEYKEKKTTIDSTRQYSSGGEVPTNHLPN